MSLGARGRERCTEAEIEHRARRVMNILYPPAPRDAGTCADWVAPPCPPPGHCFPLSLSLCAPCLSLPPPPGSLPPVLCANYTCANQPTSNEARPVALSVGRIAPLLSSQPGGWVEREPALSLPRCLTTSLTLLNYPEALTNFRPPIPLQPFARREREPSPVHWPPNAADADSSGETAVPNG